jgi:hypothetical protein
MFKFVLIPCVDGQEMKEFSRPLAGGLEKDELQVTAKEHFASDMDGDARVDSVKQTMLEAGKGLDSLTPEMLARLSSMGAAVEICTLGVPTKANGYISVSLYCDGNGGAKSLPPNKRATDIARACGHKDLIVRGDAFMGKCYDNEEEEWVRRDFAIDEAAISAPWCVRAAKDNSTKNMKAYSSSGSAQASLDGFLKQQQAQQAGASAGAGAGATITGTGAVGSGGDVIEGQLVWTQTNDDIEISIKIGPTVASKDVRVIFKTSMLFINIKDFAIDPVRSPMLTALTTAGKGNLLGPIQVDESTWCLSGTGAERALVVTLTKSTTTSWQTLLKP